MKLFTLITTAGSITATAFAGSSKEVIAPATAPASTLGGWFVGGTFGQLSDVGNNIQDEANNQISRQRVSVSNLDFDMYTLHVGRDLGRQVMGCDVAAYLEVGYLDGNMGISFQSFQSGPVTQANIDVDIVPITANIKLERQLFGQVNAYATGGLGVAFTHVSAEGSSDSGSGFYAQASVGVLYNINQHVEAYAGARWLYLNDLDFGKLPLGPDNDFAWEAGLRYNF